MPLDKKIRLGRFVLLFCLLISLVGASIPTFLYDGAAYSKYLTEMDVRERANEERIDEISADYLFGDGEVDLEELKQLSEDSNSAGEENLAWSENLHQWEYWFLVVLITFVGICVIVFPWLENSTVVVILATIVGLYLYLQAYGVVLNGGQRFSEIAVWAHATRWGLPLLLIGWTLMKAVRDQTKRERLAKFICYLGLVCCAVTFAAHGWEALNHNAPFQDLMFGSASRIGLSLTEKFVKIALTLIGIMDIFLAITIIVRPSRYPLLLMATWGLITALSRPLSIGLDLWYEAAIRSANCLLPLAVGYVYFGLNEAWGIRYIIR